MKLSLCWELEAEFVRQLEACRKRKSRLVSCFLLYFFVVFVSFFGVSVEFVDVCYLLFVKPFVVVAV